MKNKLYLFLFLFCSIFCFSSPAFAETETTRQDYISNKIDVTKNEETGEYIYTYTIYCQGNPYIGSFVLPQDMAEDNAHIITITYAGTPIYIKPTSNNEMWSCWDTSQRANFITTSKRNGGDGCKVRTYNADTKIWSDFTDYTGNGYPLDYFMHPNCVISCVGVNLFYVTNLMGRDMLGGPAFFKQSYAKLKPPMTFTYPEIEYIPNDGFRVYMDTFYNYDFTNDLASIVSDLSGFGYWYYDEGGLQKYGDYTDIFENVKIVDDGDSGYHFDLKFGEQLPLEFKTSGKTYRIQFYLTNSTVYHHKDFESFGEPLVNLSTLYSIRMYYRFSSSGLEQVDRDGNVIGGNTPMPSPDITPTPDVLQEAINEQTNAIKENTEVQKNIFQQIIELPRENYRIINKWFKISIFA